MPDNSSETSGTPGYMAPEVMKSRNHSFPVDFFAIGVIGYEFMTGTRPYCGKNRKEIKEQMLSKAAVINEENIAQGWSQESADFINKLLERKENKRLGYKEGAKELMKHHWLKYYPWDELKSKTLLAPFIPDPKDNFDKNYCESIDKISEETKSRYEEIYCSANFRKIFVNFYFKYNINNIGGYNDNFSNKEIEIINQIKNRPNNNNYNSNNSSNIIKNIRVNKINNNNQKDNNINRVINRPDSQISSMNSTTKKEYESHNNNTNIKKPSAYKKPLSHSNSTKEIYSNNNMERYLKIKQSQIMAQKKISKNQNIYRQKKSSIGNNNSTKFNRIPSSSKGNGTSININNYYTNNIFSAIYNNFLPHQNYEKKHEPDNKYKKVTQRASSVFYQKRPVSKSNFEKNKNKIENDNKVNNKNVYRK